MDAVATTRINGGFGTFDTGKPLTGVPAGVQDAWVEAGIAAYATAPAPETGDAPAPQAAVAAAPETAVSRPRKASGRMLAGG